MSRPDGDDGNVITCTHDGLAEHLWEPPQCPVAIPWAVRPAAPAADLRGTYLDPSVPVERFQRPAAPALDRPDVGGEFRVTTSAAPPVWATTGEPFHARRSHRPAAAAAEVGEMTEAGELRVRLQYVEHDLEHVVRERDQAEAEAARLQAAVERVDSVLILATDAQLRDAIRRALDGEGTDG